MKITCSKNFSYEVEVKHWPETGTSAAYYQGRLIAQREYSRGPLPPMGDDDREHEAYDERLDEWCAAAEADLAPKCKEYFDSLK